MSLISTPRNLIATSVFLLALAAFFAVLNKSRIKSLNGAMLSAMVQQQATEIRRVAQDKSLKAREAAVVEANRRIKDADSKAAQAEGDLARAQKDKADLQARLDTMEAEITSLRKNVGEFGGKPATDIPGLPATAEADAQVDELRHSLDSAEREKEILSDKLRTMQERVGQMEDQRKRRIAARSKPGVRGTVLAVNQAYNFVVLNLGGRHGVEPNTEMLIVRGGTLIGKIRISSVEPATSIGDIITGSLARGVQVQPGDIVIYGGSNS
jgi:predicted  nucleic acid-binding Zn-ribbon protein